jgi:hypothetical protein
MEEPNYTPASKSRFGDVLRTGAPLCEQGTQEETTTDYGRYQQGCM